MKCGRISSGLLLRLTLDDFIEKANLIHQCKYNYSKTLYNKGKTMIDIICPEHGIFRQRAEGHLNGNGCPACAYCNISHVIRNTQDEMIERFKKIHGERYDYSEVIYQTMRTHINIICNIHGIFQQFPEGHMYGQGCPRCSKQYYSVSKISQEWLSMIKASCPLLELEYRIPDTNYFADGYDPSTRTIYEFHGDYWHGNPNRYDASVFNEITKCTMGQLLENTIKKKEVCISLGYRYVEIWEHTWKKCKKLLRRIQRRIITNRQ